VYFGMLLALALYNLLLWLSLRDRELPELRACLPSAWR
jgi:hypothetical protein